MKSQLLPPGTPAPPFALPDQDGLVHDLADYAGERILLAFYRGHWCDHCRHQLKTFREEFQEFADRGVTLLAVSAETQEQARTAAAATPFPFPLLSDPELEVIERYGVAQRPEADGRGIARPAVFLIDPTGIIRFAYVGEDAGDRPALGMLLLALDRMESALVV